MRCHRCGGSGLEPDWKRLGLRVRRERLRRGIALRKMAKLLRVSASHLCDMELGRRSWNGPAGRRYLKRFGIKMQGG